MSRYYSEDGRPLTLIGVTATFHYFKYFQSNCCEQDEPIVESRGEFSKSGQSFNFTYKKELEDDSSVSYTPAVTPSSTDDKAMWANNSGLFRVSRQTAVYT